MKTAFNSYEDNKIISLYKENPFPLKTNKKLFCEFISEYIERKHVTKSSRAGYKSIGDHILKYCNKYDKPYPFTNSIGVEFTENFVYYLQCDCNLMLNTVVGMLEKLRALLNKAALYGHPIDNTFREVKLKSEESYSVYLPEDEILKIYFFNDILDKREEIVKDYFIIGCLTGLRFSDFSRIDKSHFQDNNTVIRMKTKKTGKIVHIPVDKYVLEIMEKHNWKLPKCGCIQAFNGTLRYLCMRIGFNEEIRLERTVGLNVVCEIRQKWEMICSHTARRSFATNMYKAGFMVAEIMGITGHESEKTFYRYIRFSNESIARSMINHPYFRRNT
jgi:Phage integrase family.